MFVSLRVWTLCRSDSGGTSTRVKVKMQEEQKVNVRIQIPLMRDYKSVDFQKKFQPKVGETGAI